MTFLWIRTPVIRRGKQLGVIGLMLCSPWFSNCLCSVTPPVPVSFSQSLVIVRFRASCSGGPLSVVVREGALRELWCPMWQFRLG